MMVNFENHKGSFCIYASLFCQEGYCSECSTYLKRAPIAQNENRRQVVESQEKRQPVLSH